MDRPASVPASRRFDETLGPVGLSFDTGRRGDVYSASAAKAGRVQDAHDGLRVLDLSYFYEMERAGEGHGFRAQELIGLAGRPPLGQTGCHEQVDAFVRESRGGEHRSEERRV